MLEDNIVGVTYTKVAKLSLFHAECGTIGKWQDQ